MTTSFAKSLLQHLRNNQTSKCKSLLITSTPPPQFLDNLSNYQKQINQNIEKTKFQIGIQQNIPTISSSIASAYPTSDAIMSTIELAKRGGATERIIGVGSRAAIDLAKSVTMALNSSDNNVGELVLVPSTLGGVMASTMEDVLVYHVHEEGLCLPSGLQNPLFPVSGGDTAAMTTKKTIIAPGNTNLNSDIVMLNYLDEEDIVKKSNTEQQHQQSSPFMQEVAHAILAISIDISVALCTTSTSTPNNSIAANSINETLEDTILNAISVLQSTNDCTEDNDNSPLLKQQMIIKALLQIGLILNHTQQLFEKNQIKRPASLAMASALLPPYFPQVNILTFLSSLTPAMSQIYTSSEYPKAKPYLDIIHNHLFSTGSNRLIPPPSLASMMETRSQPNVETMLDSIHSNLILWDNYKDEKESILEEILHKSLNR